MRRLLHTVKGIRTQLTYNYHVPAGTERPALVTVRETITGLTASENTSLFSTTLLLPFAGYRSLLSSNVENAGSYGRYWSSTAHDGDYAYDLGFDSSSLAPQLRSRRSAGLSVRCFKNSPLTSDLWTEIYDWTGWKIYHNIDNKTITLAPTGWTNITIRDRNEWATAYMGESGKVAIDWYGCYYQWWNNYGFPNSWTVTTSSEMVDTSSYEPSTYSSSTFIIRNASPYRWDSDDNRDLWWNVTNTNYARRWPSQPE